LSDVDIDLVRLLGTRFIERRDVKAVMGDPHVEKGGKPLHWQPVREPFTMKDFEDHLSGRRTFGHYMVSPEGNVKLFAYDIDLRENKPPVPERDDPGFEGSYITEDSDEGIKMPCDPRKAWLEEDHPAKWFLTQQLRCLAEALAIAVHDRLGIEVAIASSGGKGLHVYGFTGSVQATFAREAALGIIQALGSFEAFRGESFFMHKSEFQNLTVEVFPKQTTLDGKDLGNLMKLPLGVHRDTGRRGEFITAKAPYTELRTMDPKAALGGELPW
jgi:hypothetical protein